MSVGESTGAHFGISCNFMRSDFDKRVDRHKNHHDEGRVLTP